MNIIIFQTSKKFKLLFEKFQLQLTVFCFFQWTSTVSKRCLHASIIAKPYEILKYNAYIFYLSGGKIEKSFSLPNMSVQRWTVCLHSRSSHRKSMAELNFWGAPKNCMVQINVMLDGLRERFIRKIIDRKFAIDGGKRSNLSCFSELAMEKSSPIDCNRKFCLK